MAVLEGNVVVVTGALGLIGRNMARALADLKAQVVILDLHPRNEALAKLASHGLTHSNITYKQADITIKGQLRQVCDEMIRDFGRVDGLVNNAGLNPKVEDAADYCYASFEEADDNLWREEIEVNLIGSMLCSQIFGRAMNGGGSIVNISSIYGVVGPDQELYRSLAKDGKDFVKPVSYSVTKGALIALTKYLASYWGVKNIRVNCVVFGGVFDGQGETFVDDYKKRVPLGRMARQDEYNGIIAFLLSDQSSYMTGSVVAVDGGFTCR